MSKPRDDLVEQLNDQLHFLRDSNASFDKGNKQEAKRLAVVSRVLLHDTRHSRSLLSQLKLKERMSYLNTADPFNPRNKLSHHGLVGIRLTIPPTGDQWPARDATDDFQPHLASNTSTRLTPFTHWWGELVIKDSQAIEWKRSDIVKVLANKQGGAHVHPEVNEPYEAIAQANSIGWEYGQPEGEGVPFKGNAVYASMRQIAYELDMTLARELPRRLPGFD